MVPVATHLLEEAVPVAVTYVLEEVLQVVLAMTAYVLEEVVPSMTMCRRRRYLR